MYDMNFFLGLKHKGSDNKSFITFLIILLLVVVLLNGLLFGAAYLKFNEINDDIDQKQAFLSDPATIDQVNEANKARADVSLSNEYLKILQQADAKRNEITLISSELLDHIRTLTPITTQITASSISGTSINLSCVSTVDTDPLDMFHAFLHDDAFLTASLSTVTMQQLPTPTPEPSPAITQAPEEPAPTAPVEPTETEPPQRTFTFSIQATLVTGGDQE